MSKITVQNIRLTQRVRQAIESACRMVEWAAKPTDPMVVAGWFEELVITDLLPVAQTGNPHIDYEMKDLNVAEFDLCEVDIHFEVDHDPKQPFWVSVRMAKTVRAGWTPIWVRSGVPSRWFQVHPCVGYAGVDYRLLTIVNSEKDLEENAGRIGIFQFPYRDIPAKRRS